MRLNQLKNFRSSPWLSVFGFSNSAASAGLSVSALNADKITEIAMVTANCWYNRPVIPGINAVGTNTADSTSAMPTTGPEISSIALSAAAFGASPSSMCLSTASTTTIASSTTNPIASTSPNNDSVFTENPNTGNKTKVPTSDTGTASNGISVALHPCKKMYTTMMTSPIAITSVSIISLMPSVTASVVSSDVT